MLLIQYFHYTHVYTTCSVWEPEEPYRSAKFEAFWKHFNQIHPSETVILKSGHRSVVEWADVKRKSIFIYDVVDSKFKELSLSMVVAYGQHKAPKLEGFVINEVGVCMSSQVKEYCHSGLRLPPVQTYPVLLFLRMGENCQNW